ncbi:MAG TPA: pyruvate dehydrogenase (acetyl-transferring) E1 component subunit alpha [Chloroflexota bacterium]|nr:pyruvate dehydrogenase (acetyl-transferring) E1 component subunit alpha [Chloroflexota bacterium]
MVKEVERNRLQPHTTQNAPVEFHESRQELHDMLAQMILIRHFEDKVYEMYTRAKIGGYCHMNHGEEATIIGAIRPLRPQDWIISFYREHGHILARGTEPKYVMAELFGREDGVARGRGGSMHLFDASRRFLGGYGIVAGQMPLAIGVGYSTKYRDADEVTLLLTGDGAMANGASHETLNMIGIYHLPVITLIVNNLYGMGTTVERSAANPDLWKRGEMYNMWGTQVDGMDVMQVRRTMEEAMDRARHGQPSLIEAITYRYRGHSVADAARYRTPEEVQAWRGADPIERFYRQLLEAEVVTEQDRQEIERQVDATVQQAVDFADASPQPDPSGLFDYLYVNPPPTLNEPETPDA